MIALFSEEYAREMEKISLQNEAREEGHKAGRAEKAQDISIKLYKAGTNVEDISKLVDYSVDTVKEWLGLLPS